MSTPWMTLGTRELLRIGRRFAAYAEHIRLPDGREIEDYLQFRIPDFVVVVAVTETGHIVCERQYKHGPRRFILSLPAGAMEENEAPMAAAQRELLEETGYASNDWQFLSSRILQANAGCCWTNAFLARDCRKVSEPDSGDLEEMAIELKTPPEVIEAFSNDEMPLVSDAAALLPALMALGVLRTDQASSPR